MHHRTTRSIAAAAIVAALLAVGTGIGEDSPQFRLTLGFQHSL